MTTKVKRAKQRARKRELNERVICDKCGREEKRKDTRKGLCFRCFNNEAVQCFMCSKMDRRENMEKIEGRDLCPRCFAGVQ